MVLSAEHITVELGGPQVLPHIGDRLEFEASYVDLTVLLHDALIATRRGVVEDVWPVRQCAVVAETARRPGRIPQARLDHGLIVGIERSPKRDAPGFLALELVALLGTAAVLSR